MQLASTRFDICHTAVCARGRRVRLPVLFTVTFFRASASCSEIWFSRCRSLFCSISNCCRRPRMACLGASLRFCAPLPPNQPHMVRCIPVFQEVGSRKVRAHANRFGTQNRQKWVYMPSVGRAGSLNRFGIRRATEEGLRLRGESSGAANTWTECAVE